MKATLNGQVKSFLSNLSQSVSMYYEVMRHSHIVEMGTDNELVFRHTINNREMNTLKEKAKDEADKRNKAEQKNKEGTRKRARELDETVTNTEQPELKWAAL